MSRNENYQCDNYFPGCHGCSYKYGREDVKCNGDIRRCHFLNRHNEAMNNFITNIESDNINISRSSLIKKMREVNEQNDEKVPDWVWFVINSMESVNNGNSKKKHTNK